MHRSEVLALSSDIIHLNVHFTGILYYNLLHTPVNKKNSRKPTLHADHRKD